MSTLPATTWTDWHAAGQRKHGTALGQRRVDSEERPLPSDSKAERNTIGSVLLDPSVYGSVRARVSPDDFADELCRVLFAHIEGLAHLGKPIDVTLLYDQLRRSGQAATQEDIDDGTAAARGLVTLADLIDIQSSRPTAANAEFYADIVRQKSVSRARILDLEQQLDDEYGGRGPASIRRGPKTVGELLAAHPTLRPTIIDGLLREGETMNAISHSKVGKSWLLLSLALSIVRGDRWLGDFHCTAGSVLILDNELHPETTAHRIRSVAEALGIDLELLGDGLKVDNVRGQLLNYETLGGYLAQFRPGQFKVVLLDAHYRFLPPGMDENDNADMAVVYNLVDSYARRLNCAFVLVHHTSKGNQSNRSVTDVGSGAGSQSRATDSHLVLRPHEEPNAFVLEAAVRSWAPVAPRCLRWKFPLWYPADDLDPAALKQERRTRTTRSTPPDEGPAAWDGERFAREFVTDKPVDRNAVIDSAASKVGSARKAKAFLEQAEDRGFVHRWKFGSNVPQQVATVPQPTLPLQDSQNAEAHS